MKDEVKYGRRIILGGRISVTSNLMVMLYYLTFEFDDIISAKTSLVRLKNFKISNNYQPSLFLVVSNLGPNQRLLGCRISNIMAQHN